MIQFIGIEEKVLKKHLLHRFMPSINDMDASIVIENLIDKTSSSKSYLNLYETFKNRFF